MGLIQLTSVNRPKSESADTNQQCIAQPAW